LSVENPKIYVIVSALVLIFCGIAVLRMRFRSRRGASLDTLFYESLPFLYLGIGFYVLLFRHSSKIAVASGVILLFCATKVLQWRVRNRQFSTPLSRKSGLAELESAGPSSQKPTNTSYPPGHPATDASDI
jgi:hypothetical protein